MNSEFSSNVKQIFGYYKSSETI